MNSSDVDQYGRLQSLNQGAIAFNNELSAMCDKLRYGGPPYNYNPNTSCGQTGYHVCKEWAQNISWDGVHYTEAANAIVASKILSTNYSKPQIEFSYFCY
ncbi:unnamed protein product [Ilex paraguariensis]|uniref:GDSL esterase/lipase n=1 Tax=Ilex paraguariensis TaxID=185542 RepID=A0ABC8TBM7_9AQUA